MSQLSPPNPRPVEDFRFPTRRPLWVSKSLSGGSRKLDEIPAVGDPTHMVQIGRGHRVSAGEGQWRVAVQRCVRTCRVIVNLELVKLPFQVAAIPEQHLVEKFTPHRADQALDERVGQRHRRDGLDRVDLKNPQVRPPTVRLEQRVMIGAELAPRKAGLNIPVTVVARRAFGYAEREHDGRRGPRFTRV